MKRTLGLAATESEFPRLIRFAEEFAGHCGLADCEKARLLITLEELFTNAVHYGHPGGRLGRIEIALAARPGHLEIEFCDDGIPFDPLARELSDRDRDGNTRKIGGDGLRIVRAYSDEARYQRDGGRNRLTLVRRLSSGGFE
jgi:serine/threonine-protein kinase RsbW